MMNDDVVKGTWKELTGKARQKWGQLTDDELMQFQGKREELSGLLQKKYGYAKERADHEVDAFFTENKYDPMNPLYSGSTDTKGHTGHS